MPCPSLKPGSHRRGFGNAAYPSGVHTNWRELMFESIGMPELMVILVLAVVLFGAKKVPDLGKGLGEGIRNFRASLKGEAEDGSKSA
jgi:sec-independent protein translocase protein TatA